MKFFGGSSSNQFTSKEPEVESSAQLDQTPPKLVAEPLGSDTASVVARTGVVPRPPSDEEQQYSWEEWARIVAVSEQLPPNVTLQMYAELFHVNSQRLYAERWKARQALKTKKKGSSKKRPRRRFSSAEKQKILARYHQRAPGLTTVAFCAEMKIQQGVLYRWLREAENGLDSHPSTTTASFAAAPADNDHPVLAKLITGLAYERELNAKLRKLLSKVLKTKFCVEPPAGTTPRWSGDQEVDRPAPQLYRTAKITAQALALLTAVKTTHPADASSPTKKAASLNSQIKHAPARRPRLITRAPLCGGADTHQVDLNSLARDFEARLAGLEPPSPDLSNGAAVVTREDPQDSFPSTDRRAESNPSAALSSPSQCRPRWMPILRKRNASKQPEPNNAGQPAHASTVLDEPSPKLEAKRREEAELAALEDQIAALERREAAQEEAELAELAALERREAAQEEAELAELAAQIAVLDKQEQANDHGEHRDPDTPKNSQEASCEDDDLFAGVRVPKHFPPEVRKKAAIAIQGILNGKHPKHLNFQKIRRTNGRLWKAKLQRDWRLVCRRAGDWFVPVLVAQRKDAAYRVLLEGTAR